MRKGAGPRKGGESRSAMFSAGGRRSVALDFTKPEGQAVVMFPLETADVLVQNSRRAFRASTRLRLREPAREFLRLIYLSSGLTAGAAATGRPVRPNGASPPNQARHAIAIVDTMTAIHLVAAINAVLFARTSTGKGLAHSTPFARLTPLSLRWANMGSYYLIGGGACREWPFRLGAQQLVEP